MDIESVIGEKVFGFSEEILSNSDLPQFGYSSNRNAAAKVVEKILFSDPCVLDRFNRYLENRCLDLPSGCNIAELLLVITPDLICDAAVHSKM